MHSHAILSLHKPGPAPCRLRPPRRQVWRERLLPLLERHLTQRVDSVTAYQLLYHEAALANLLEVGLGVPAGWAGKGGTLGARGAKCDAITMQSWHARRQRCRGFSGPAAHCTASPGAGHWRAGQPWVLAG